jgi:PPOX class probable F420-dependent enzyme
MAQMTVDEYKSFIASGTRTAKIATARADGRPHVVPVWFVLDGDDIVFSTGAKSVKAAAIRRDPRVCLCIEDDTPPYAFVMIEGTAQLQPDAPDLLFWATQIGGRYMGADRAEEFGKRNAAPSEVLVRVTPTKIIAQRDIAGY